MDAMLRLILIIVCNVGILLGIRQGAKCCKGLLEYFYNVMLLLSLYFLILLVGIDP